MAKGSDEGNTKGKFAVRVSTYRKRNFKHSRKLANVTKNQRYCGRIK